MTALELGLCTSSVISSCISQLLIKAASTQKSPKIGAAILSVAATMLIGSVLLAVAALRTLQLSQLIPFAACAYIIVPFSSRLVFNERLHSNFRIGTTLIVIGVIFTQL
ncbi:MAG: hypothetical protein NTY70_18680 [Burkholderiales bacterium]|nr:hypothetical protein [Burkholderiales bacterium]